MFYPDKQPKFSDVFGGYVNSSSPFRFVLDNSDYAQAFEKIISVFPRENVHVVDGENLIENPYEEIKKVGEFLGTRDFYTPDHFRRGENSFPCFRLGHGTNHKCMEKDKGREHPVLGSGLRMRLVNYFRPLMQAFKHMAGVDFDWLNMRNGS